VDGDHLGERLHEKRARLWAHHLFAQQSQQRIQAFIVERRSVSQPGMGRVRSEDFLQGALRIGSSTKTSMVSYGSGLTAFQRTS
jgi:hypothetical protein